LEFQGYVGQLVAVCFRVFRSIKKSAGLFLESLDFRLKVADLVLKITLVQLIDVDDVVVPVFSDGTFETNAGRAIFAKTLQIFVTMVMTPRNDLVRAWSRRLSFSCLVHLSIFIQF
jgi:hypothetical protein